jgi:hypothetical protein
MQVDVKGIYMNALIEVNASAVLRRLVLLGCSGLLGLQLAINSPRFTGRLNDIAVVSFLAFLAGISALWSP